MSNGGYFLFSENRKKIRQLERGIITERYKTIVEESRDIFSLEVSNNTTGSFAFGFGSIDGELRYYFYVNEGKGKKLSHLKN